MGRDKKIQNAFKRSEVHRKSKREKAQAKLKRRMETRKAEKEKGVGAELKKERLAKNVPRTLDNTRIYDSSSYLTADPRTLQKAAEDAAAASEAVNNRPSDMENDEEDDDGSLMEEAEQPEAGPSTLRRSASPARSVGSNDEEDGDKKQGDGMENQAETIVPTQALQPGVPPKILITTSASPCKETYGFCDDLKNVFPGGKFFKRPKGRGFEIGRLARWSIKRGFNAMIVVNEDHKRANAITLINLPAGPTAYFKLTSIQLGRQISGHAKPTPHSPELILNNFTTLLGNSVGRLFGSLFPPQPQFRGRQVVTLHNQRDFLFFRRHRYMFSSPTSAKLQEIGPRFTLKLRWLRKGLPSVTASDGSIPRAGGKEEISDDEEDIDVDIQQQEDDDEARALDEMGRGISAGEGGKKQKDLPEIPPLDEEQEYEWKWKPKMEVSRRTFFL